jgi:predicted amidohydrolase
MNRERRFRVGVVQFNSKNDEPGENLEKAVNYIENLVEEETDLILLPEMFNSGYGVDEKTVSSAIGMQEETIETLSAMSDYNDITIVAGIINKTGGGLYNSSVVVQPYSDPVYYNKTHLFRDEKKVFSPGNALKTIEFDGIRFGLQLCYEIGFPEVSRKLSREGAQVLLVPFAFGKTRRYIYDIATRARAIENGCYLVAASQNGSCPSMEMVGESRIVSPSGEILCSCGDGEGFCFADIDTKKIERYRFKESGDSHGYFSNFRDDLYG